MENITQTQLELYAAALARHITGGEVIELVGDVGAGKTTFTKALATALGVTGGVQSPSFTISNRYAASGGLTLAHYDFYRLHDPGIMRDELAETLGDNKVVTVLEWSDIVAHVLPSDRLTIIFTPIDDAHRSVAVHAGGSVSRRLQKAVV